MRFLDLFSGAGGLSLGFVQAGWRCTAAVDCWNDATSTYKLNFPSHATISCDVADFSANGFGLGKRNVDWVIGGPPCQGFSTVGKRYRRDPRNKLVNHFARIVQDIKPLGFLVENVVGLRDMNFVGRTMDLFEGIGYHVDVFVLRSADFGIPQLRHRIFFVGNRMNKVFMPPTPTVPQMKCGSGSRYTTVWDAIGDLPILVAGERSAVYSTPPASAYQRLMRRLSRTLQGHEASNHPPHLLTAISYIPDGGDRTHIPERFQPSSGFHNSYSRLHSGSPAVALTQNMGKPSGTRCIHPFQNRGLTAREGARLQGFPDTFHFQGGMTSQRLQIANAVSPILACVLAQSLTTDSSWLSNSKKQQSAASLLPFWTAV
jgi:DNA (cytosine-5)-methyltransferase 1